MKKIIYILLAAVLIASTLLSVCAGAYETDFDVEINSNIALLASVDYDKVIYEKNADLKTPPSSLAKIVTALIALDFYGTDGLDTVITADSSAILSVPFGSVASGLKSGEELTVKQLLYYILVQSANDATHILAFQIGKENKRDGLSELDSFVAMMNEYASNLGCESTHFCDATGIDESGSYSTARDLLKIANAAYKSGELMDICSETAYVMPETNKNQSRLLTTGNNVLLSSSEYYYEYAEGMKTGFSDRGMCIITTSERNGRHYIAIVMESGTEELEKDPSEDEDAPARYLYHSFADAKKLLKWANDNLIYTNVVDENSLTGLEIPVKNGLDVDYVRLAPNGKLNALVTRKTSEKELRFVVEEGAIPKEICTSVKKGDFVCTAKVFCGDEYIGESELVYADTVNIGFFLVVVSTVASVLGITVVRVIVILAIIALASLLIYPKISKKRKPKRKIRVVERSNQETNGFDGNE